MEDYKRLKSEFTNHTFRKILKDTYDDKCFNCGNECEVEYHHIVPLSLGGTNRLTNIVPLCSECHKKAHGSVNIRKTFKSSKSGRKKEVAPSDYEEILWQYVYGEIGRKGCQRMLGLSEGAKIQEKWYYKEFLEQNGIKYHKNSVDLLISKNKILPEGKLVAVVVFEDGKTIERYTNQR
jgi:hypothetical protein